MLSVTLFVHPRDVLVQRTRTQTNSDFKRRHETSYRFYRTKQAIRPSLTSLAQTCSWWPQAKLRWALSLGLKQRETAKCLDLFNRSCWVIRGSRKGSKSEPRGHRQSVLSCVIINNGCVCVWVCVLWLKLRLSIQLLRKRAIIKLIYSWAPQTELL